MLQKCVDLKCRPHILLNLDESEGSSNRGNNYVHTIRGHEESERSSNRENFLKFSQFVVD